MYKALAISALLFLGACSQDRKVAEREVRTDIPWTEFRVMKITRWHLVSATDEYIVTCTSPATGRARGEPRDFVPRGSVFVDRIGWLEVRYSHGEEQMTAAAAVVAASLRAGPGWIVWMHGDIRLSLDGCATWSGFHPPRELAERLAAAGSQRCSTRECDRQVFRNLGVYFSDVKAERGPGGARLSFVLNSAGRANAGGVVVTTEDGGRTWRATERETPVEVQPDVARYVHEKPEPVEPAAASPYALSEAEVSSVPAPRLEGPTMAMLVSDLRAAARAGDQSRLMRLSMEATREDEREAIDRYTAALLDAMVAKAAQR